MEKVVFRTEKKYKISYTESRHLYHYFSKVLHPDENNGVEGYKVRSLYFDSLFDDDYVDKLDGLELRKKIRLRVYDPTSNFAKLELKQKQGSNQLKRSLSVNREQAERLINLDYDVLLEIKSAFAFELFCIMKKSVYIPRCIVEYDRAAFMVEENNTRVTFDSNIRATESCFDLFDEHLNLNLVQEQDDVVMEVKYDHFLLSYVKAAVNAADRMELAVSKYVLARAIRNL